MGPNQPVESEHRENGWLDLVESAELDRPQVIHMLGSTPRGLTAAEARRRLEQIGSNAVRSFAPRPLAAIRRQLCDPLHLALGSLLLVSWWGSEAGVPTVLAFLLVSAALGFFDEYRVERAIEELHARIRHTIPARRDGRSGTTDVTALVPGDVVSLCPGSVVPADLRILESNGLVCDESVLGGNESEAKSADACRGATGSKLSCCLLMGSFVRSGSALAIVVRTGGSTSFGELTRRLDPRASSSPFEKSLGEIVEAWHRPLRWIAAGALAFAALSGRPILADTIFVLSFFVGLSPRRILMICRLGLVHATRRLAARSVMVKRTATVEDLAQIRTLLLDPVGILTEGRPRLRSAVDTAGTPSKRVIDLALACSEALPFRARVIGGSALDRALLDSVHEHGAHPHSCRLDSEPFEERTGVASALIEDGTGRWLVVRGLPEAVLPRLGAGRRGDALAGEPASGLVHAVATARVGAASSIRECQAAPLDLAGFLTFDDPGKPGAVEALERLRGLGVEVKVVASQGEGVARELCHRCGIEPGKSLDPVDLDALTDRELGAALDGTRLIVARSATQRARIVRLERARGGQVGYLGNGRLDAVALHEADVGIAADSASDVARDAADVVLLRPDLHAIADAITESRATFSNAREQALTLASVARASLVANLVALCTLLHLPLLPSQILGLGLIREAGARAIEGDHIDARMPGRPIGADARLGRSGDLFSLVILAAQLLALGLLAVDLGATDGALRSGWFLALLGSNVLALLGARRGRLSFSRRPASAKVSFAILHALAFWWAAARGWLTNLLEVVSWRESAVDDVARSRITGRVGMRAARAVWLGSRAKEAPSTKPVDDRVARLSFRWSGRLRPATADTRRR